MAVSLICRFRDGGCRVVDDRYNDLKEVITVALDLADRHGRDAGTSEELPKCFEIWEDDGIIFSVAVIRGGLSPGAGYPK